MINYYHKLIYFLPLALVTGPFLPDLIIVMCSVLFLIDTFRFRLFKYYNNNFFKIFIIFFILLNISSINSEYLSSFKYSIGYIRYGVFSIFLFYVLKNFNNFKINFSIIFFVTFIFILVDSYIQFLFGKNIFLIDLQNYGTGLSYVTSFFGDEKKLGSLLSRLTPLFFMSILLLNEKYNIKLSFVNYLIIFIFFVTILLTTERVSIFFISCLLIFTCLKSRFLVKSKKIFFLSFLLILFIVFFYNPNLFEKIKSVFYQIGVMSPGYKNSGYEEGIFFFSKFYQDQIQNTLTIFSENVFFGIGAKNYKLYVDNGWHPHNFHGQVLAELGLLAYLIFVFTFIYFLIKSIKILFFEKHISYVSEIKSYIIIMFLLNLLPIPSGDFFNNWLNIIIYLPVGFLLYFDEKKI